MTLCLREPLLSVCLSGFHTEYCRPSKPTKVNIATPANVYVYQSRNVLLAYSIVGAAAIAANALGLYAFNNSRLSYDLSFSAIACSTRGIHFSEGLRAHERRGALPLDERLARTRLKFYDSNDIPWYGFGAAGDDMV